MPYFLKLFSVFLLATVKFFYTPLYAYLTGLQFWETVAAMIAGGMASFLVFYYVSHIIIISTRYVKPAVNSLAPNPWLIKYYERKERKEKNAKNRKVFTKRNRLIVKLRNAGAWAIVVTTPIFLSIPLGAFLLRRYYSRRRGIVWFTLLAITIEGFLLCLLVWSIPEFWE